MSQTAEEVKQQLDELRALRGNTKGCISRVKTYVNSKADTLSATELECRLGILESYWKLLLSQQTSIEKLTPDDLSNSIIRGELEDLYCEVKSKILSLMTGKGRLSLSDGNRSFVVPAQSKVKLPPLKLPQFSGKYSEYPKFIATFNKLVHDDPEKFCKPAASLVDKISAHLCALRALGTDTDILNSIIIHIANSKLDSGSQARWDEAIVYEKLPTWNDCEQVLSRRCKFLEGGEKKLIHPHGNSQSFQRAKPFSTQAHKGSTTLKVTATSCVLCSEATHSIGNCLKFKQMPILERFELAKRMSLCINCLTKGHTVKNCRSSKCRVCFRPHHTSLHRFPQDTTNPTSLSSKNQSHQVSTITTIGQFEPSAPSTLCSAVQYWGPRASKGHVFLATAVVQIKDKAGCFHFARALLDSASQQNFITRDLAHKLGLKRNRINADISGIGDVVSKVLYETQSMVKSRVNDFHMDFNMWILPSITGLQPEADIDVHGWKLPPNLELADPNFHKPQPIDMLVGADKFFQLLSVGQVKLSNNLPILQKTLLGWIVCGTYSVSSAVKQICTIASNIESVRAEDNLNSLVEKFWRLESLESSSYKLTAEHRLCEDLFINTISQMENGRFMVKLPFKAPVSSLGTSFEIAKRRLLSLEKRLQRDSSLKDEYSKFLEEYQSLGHMEPISPYILSSNHYYMPHSCVLRPLSSSTKLRVVFDASCRTSTQISLNDILLVGPLVQNDLFSILFRFRCWKYALTADICKMFRQILVYPEDRDLQCILWRYQRTGELQTFRLNAVTYGTASAPYLATRCLNHLADIHGTSVPLACSVIKEDFYVDDLLTGADTELAVVEFRDQIQSILAARQFELKKWYSNADSLLKEVPETHREKPIKMHDSEVIKTLGIAWDPAVDQFLYSCIPIKRACSKFTKRSILSDMSKLFDPLGLINPLVVRAKIFVHELWLLQLNWDESLPFEFCTRWETYLKDLENLHLLRIPRFVLSKETIQQVEIHGFCDASMRAYGCCLYIKCVDIYNNISVYLLAAYSKVARTKTLRTLPCLELCGAELLSQLLSKCRGILKTQINHVYLWTDSVIVLGWLASHASNWKPFVGNRVSTIQEAMKESIWRYVPSKSNPADVIWRGATMNELQNSIWFTRPDFLYKSPEDWPKRVVKLDDLPESRKIKTILNCIVEESFLESAHKWSSFTKIRRIFAYVLRFIHKLKRKKKKESLTTGVLTAMELKSSLKKTVLAVQHREFAEEIELVKERRYSTLEEFTSNVNSLP